jgi:hypothetical protein
MLIAVSGSAGCGKTTLVNNFGAIYKFLVIDEGYTNDFNNPVRSIKDLEIMATAFEALLEKKFPDNLCQKNTICDRSPIDLYNLWFHKGLWQLKNRTEVFYDKCMVKAKEFDFIIFPPYAAFELSQNDPQSLQRNLNKSVQMINYATIYGLSYLNIDTKKIIMVPAEIEASAWPKYIATNFLGLE